MCCNSKEAVTARQVQGSIKAQCLASAGPPVICDSYHVVPPEQSLGRFYEDGEGPTIMQATLPFP